MANDNNNINELVTDDDDPTVELEMPTFAPDISGTGEADAKTYDTIGNGDSEVSSGVTVSELRSDLRSRKKTISKLQYDIQQLHAKWLGLEAEIGARESQTDQLNVELSLSRDAVDRKEKLIKKRDRKIKSLKSEIRQRDEDYRQLKMRDEVLQLSIDEASPSAECAPAADAATFGNFPAEELRQRLSRSEAYSDSIRQKSQDLIKSNLHFEREIESLSQLVDDAVGKNVQLADKLASTDAIVEKLQADLESIQSRHEDEIRLIRFDLGEAQSTIVESKELTSQIASDLVDSRNFKEELERMLGDVEEQSTERIDELQKEVRKLTRTADRYEQKLTTKSEAISVLLEELAKKSEQLESIGEIEEVIHDIDERMSERSTKSDHENTRVSGDRITRVLIGTVADQVLRFPLFKDRLTIGRNKDNDIQLTAEYVSRRHAVVQTDGESTRIIDWGSKNGIHVNSKKVSEHFLCHGDIVMIGNARFRYEERKMRDA